MSTRTPHVDYEEPGHPELWGADKEPQSVRDAYDAQLRAEGHRVVPAPRQSPEEDR